MLVAMVEIAFMFLFLSAALFVFVMCCYVSFIVWSFRFVLCRFALLLFGVFRLCHLCCCVLFGVL